MQDPVSELPRIPLPRTPVNKARRFQASISGTKRVVASGSKDVTTVAIISYSAWVSLPAEVAG
jgi:hypothetical protein